MPDTPSHHGSFGPNAWLVDDLYDQFLADPNSVAPSWRDFFAGYQQSAVPVPPAPPTKPEPSLIDLPTDVTPLRGPAARLATNMTTSLTVPTATSVRSVPARLLELNRSALNQALARTSGAKVSYTHLIAYAITRGLCALPEMNAVFVPDIDARGTPGLRQSAHVNLGLAIDVTRGTARTLLVPVIHEADTLDFPRFLLAYEDLVRRAHANTLVADDFAGATATLTNPGTIGTSQSVPRLMAGQGVIIGVGALTRPPGFEATDPKTIADLGVGSVLNLTSTYDHRIIQGAQSGLFLKYVAECLSGDHQFYDDTFAALAIPHRPLHYEPDSVTTDATLKQIRVTELINMYRVRGHLYANLNPLSSSPPPRQPELELGTYGLTIWDLPRRFSVDGLAGHDTLTLEEALQILQDAYCSTIGIEYGHVLDPAEKQWLRARAETPHLDTTKEERGRIINALTEAEVFEKFLHSRYVGQKRFGLEGAESTIVALRTILDAAASDGIAESVIGMAHRGRLNVMANIVGKSYHDIFSEFEGNLDPQSVQGSGDVKYHKGSSGVYHAPSGTLAITLAANPSHLEAVSPVAEGLVRARQDLVLHPAETQAPPTTDSYPYLAVLVHGDAAFAGQGVVAETLNMSQLPGYRIGGTIHVVINNQVGFTTDPASGHSSFYPTDVAKMIQAPVFHVNGDDPEAVAHAARLAYDYRQVFHGDVVLDIVCYRRYGHNEGDDPSYTQPLMYKTIDALRSVRYLYVSALVRRSQIDLAEAEEILDSYQARLQAILDEVRTIPVPTIDNVPAPHITPDSKAPATGVPLTTLKTITETVLSAPTDFTLHPKLARQFAQRATLAAAGEIDWSLAEALAFGSLLEDGRNVRLVGQDTRRGTFSQRHAALIDYDTGAQFIPLAHLFPTQGSFTVRDSFLSEYAVLGFEYGYSLAAPGSLVLWEAQFGDFINGAQIVVDNFLVSGLEKWDQHSGLVLLLPHGYEGQGPEHSSARLERFLAATANNNIRIAIPSTAAQYFHLLRAQALRTVPAPLIVFSPKSLLRSELSRSPRADFETGSFQPLLDDPRANHQLATRLILASGKVAHEAITKRDERGLSTIAVARLEQLYPGPHQELTTLLTSYPNLTEILWLQEEPENMGAWPFLSTRLSEMSNLKLGHVARAPSSSPATGSALLHAAEQDDLLVRALTGPLS